MTTVAIPTPSVRTKGHLSYSAITDYATCPKQFELRRVIGLEGDPGYALAGGSAVHACIEAYERQRYRLL